MSISNNMMSAKDVAKKLGIPVATVNGWRHLKTGPRYYRIGGRIFYREDDVDAWVKVVDPAVAEG